MTPNSSIDPVLLGRYLGGTASTEERAAVEAWIGAAPERRGAVEALRAAWAADARRLGAPYDVDAGWAELVSRLGAPRTPSVGMPVRSTRRPASATWKRIGWAAAMFVAVGAGARWWLTAEKPAPRSVVPVPALREYTTPRGRRAVFRLLDGSEITLNADSRIQVPADFGAARRDVFLDGEAYFSIVHDSLHPFVVHTAGSAVRDVGTRFGVRAYADAHTERVAVAEGAVAVATGASPTSAETPLRAGQVAALAHGRVRMLRGADVTQELAWTDGRLVFANVPLSEAAQRLGRWYDLDIRIADSSLARRPVSGSYSNEPVAEVLTLITSAVGARYAWRGRLVTISLADTTQ